MTKFEYVMSDAHVVPETTPIWTRELERSEKEQSAETANEFAELLAKMETLKSVHVSRMLDQKRDELHRMPCARHADWRDRPWLGPSSRVCT